jgi:RNA polymerase sigma-70 factor (ECF subfamily)
MKPVASRSGARAALSRDKQARFGAVVLPHLDDAYGLARWLTGSRTDAEDVVQEACLRALSGIGGFADGNSRAWVLTIVRNVAYTWMRKNRPADIVAVDDLERADVARIDDREAESAEAALIARSDSALLQSAIAALPTPLRETVVLREIQGLSYRQIAAVTAAPVGTVMSRLSRARRALIAAMGERAK